MSGAVSGKFTVKSCGKAHAWCARCRPMQAEAQRKPKPEPKQHERSCRSCGRCDTCLGYTAPEGMKLCRKCGETKPVTAFSRRTDTGGRRNQCMACQNGGQHTTRCEGCNKTFARTSETRTLCATCRPPVTRACSHCATAFVGSTELRRYCSATCREEALKSKRAVAYARVRLAALKAYGGAAPACECCSEGLLQFLALDHIDGGGHQQRQETGGGGFYTWLRRNNYPEGFRVLCHNCNLGRQINGGVCPHKQ